ncbi:MAG: methane monooxygenase/ammonia monooxygenase subunit C [Candidatus Entotheonellia bacterium]
MARGVTGPRALEGSEVITGWNWLVTLGVVVGVLFAAAITLRVWQQLFAWTAGLDSTSSEFATYWMPVFWAELAVLGVVAVLWWGWTGFKKCRLCEAQRASVGRVKPGHELSHIAILWIYTTVGTFSAFMQFAFFGEQDATWHQVAIRDTALTPSHIPLFYFWFPLLIITTVATFLYGRTRLPHIYRDRGYPLSMLLMIGGISSLSFWVAVNEFFHSFWQTEERFSAPLHWGFVIFFYVGGAVIFSIWFQTLPRMYELIGQLQVEPGGTGARGRIP